MDKELNYDNPGLKVVAIDSTGIGDFMPDWFEKNTRWYVHRVHFSRPQKDIMYKNLRVVIEDKLTSIPQLTDGKGYTSIEAEHFYSEMMDLQKEIVGRMLVVHHPNGETYHDDYPDSWALAEMGYVAINGVPVTRKPERVETNLSGSARKLLENRSGGGQSSDAGTTDYH